MAPLLPPQGTEEPPGEVREHSLEFQADFPAEGVLCPNGGGCRHDAGRAAADQDDRDQEGAGGRPGGKQPAFSR